MCVRPVQRYVCKLIKPCLYSAAISSVRYVHNELEIALHSLRKGSLEIKGTIDVIFIYSLIAKCLIKIASDLLDLSFKHWFLYCSFTIE